MDSHHLFFAGFNRRFRKVPLDRYFFQFVTYRYERSSTIITSNKSFSDWQELFGDPVIASAILDRLLHHCKVVNIKGHSYRLQGHSIGKQLSEKGGDLVSD